MTGMSSTSSVQAGLSTIGKSMMGSSSDSTVKGSSDSSNHHVPHHRVHSRTSPRVLLLDIDGTVIGRIASAVCEHTILTMSAARSIDDVVVVTPSARKAAERVMRASLVSRLRHGIIRPGFDEFCRQATATTANAATTATLGAPIELFVYTAAEDRWATFIVSCIESAIGVRFNRPLFTRRDCIVANDMGSASLRKSISRVLPAILTRLRRKGYDASVIPDVKALRACTALIDNTHDVGHDDTDTARIVRCPTYNYSYQYDVLSRVDVDFLHKRFPSILPLLQRYDLFPAASPPATPAPRGGSDSTPAPPMRYQRFCRLYFARLSKSLHDSDELNAVALRDRFWRDMWKGLASQHNASSRHVIDIPALNRSLTGASAKRDKPKSNRHINSSSNTTNSRRLLS